MDVRDLEIKIARSENLPVLPQIVGSVLKLADDPQASPKALERIIERDPAITAKILRVANSAFYGLNQVPSIGRAISILGLNAIRSLVVGVAYQQIISGKTASAKFSKLEFWQHSLAVAVGARILAKLKLPLKAEELYCAGMMHDVGLMILDRFCPEELDRAIQASIDQNIELHVAEHQVLGFDHSEVGALLADRWGLSPLMAATIRNHHTMIESDTSFTASCYISAANTLAHQCGYKNNGSKELVLEFHPAATAAIELPEQQLEIIRSVMVQEVQKAQDAFQIK